MNDSQEKQDKTVVGRLALFSTMITLAFFGLFNPHSLRKLLRDYQIDEIQELIKDMEESEVTE